MTALAFASRGIATKVLEKSPEKIEKSKDFAKKTGIEINQKFDDLFNVAVNAASSPDAFSDAIIKVLPGGFVIFFSGLSENIPVKTFNEIHYKQLKVCGAYGCTKKQMEKAIDFLNKKSEAFEHLIEKTVDLGKVANIMPYVESGKYFKFTIAF
jgi:D-arabinose 1-dehydrogenase-like Zn-dependent alcohol dehydrogenase